MEPEQVKIKISGLTGLQMTNELRELSNKAAKGDSIAFKSLSLILEDCQNLDNWQNNGHYTSAAIHAVAQMKNLKAMQLLVHLIKNLPEGAPSGSIELLASILPEFKRFVMGPVKEMIQFDQKTPAFLISLQTMCNLYLNEQLEGNDVDFLIRIIEKLDIIDYSTQHIIELVQNNIISKKTNQDAELAKILEE